MKAHEEAGDEADVLLEEWGCCSRRTCPMKRRRP